MKRLRRSQLALFDLAPVARPRKRRGWVVGPTGVERRDAALKKTHENSEGFIELALARIHDIPKIHVTGEDVRLYLESIGLVPYHHNVWGALIMHAVRSGRLVPTERFVPMQDPRAHARLTRVYEKV